MSAISPGQRIIAPLIIASRLIFSLSVIDRPEWASTVDPRIVGASTRAARRDGGDRALISARSVVRADQPLVRRRTLIAGGALSAAAFFALLLGHAGAVPPNTTSLHHDFQPLPIAVPEFSPLQPADSELAHDTTQIITANLKGSGVFAPIDPQTYVEKDIAFDSVPRWADWRMINAQTLVTGRVGRPRDGRVNASFRLWDVSAGLHLLGETYDSTEDNWRHVANIISDAVYERITGVKGHFDAP
jgi:TolB protein